VGKVKVKEEKRKDFPLRDGTEGIFKKDKTLLGDTEFTKGKKKEAGKKRRPGGVFALLQKNGPVQAHKKKGKRKKRKENSPVF